MTHELKKRLDALRAVAPRLNAATDDANRIVAMVEKVLVDELNLGVPAEATFAHYPDGRDDDGVEVERLETLAFKRVNGRYRIVVETLIREAMGHQDVHSLEDTPWPSCTREQKLNALPKLPLLLDRILSQSQKLAEAAEEAAESIKAMLAEDDAPPVKSPGGRLREAKAQADQEVKRLVVESYSRAEETARPHQGLPYTKPERPRGS
jgi:L-fucose mutarotase/ribose pyranase (RbsD/FucU family)